MVRFRYLASGVWLLLAGWIGPNAIHAQETEPDSITLINGAIIRGTVTDISTNGLVMNVGSTSRIYPWVTLAPGSRFQYDVAYRVNISGHLEGLPATALTNQPDPKYDPRNPTAPVEEDAVVNNAEASTLAGLGWAGHESIVPTSLRGLNSAATAGASFWALRIGTGPDDVVVFAYESGPNPKLSMLPVNDSRAMIESPKASENNAPVWRTDKRVFPVSFGSSTGEVAVSWIIERKDADARRWVEMDVSVALASGPTRFALRGEATRWSAAKEKLAPRYPYSAPELHLLVSTAEQEAALAGEVRMGRWQVFPGEGKSLRVSIEVLDAKGARAIKEDVELSKSEDPAAWPLRLALGKKDPGGKYQAKASVDLGSWLGRADKEFAFVFPDPLKP